jgi:hypothetical protein
VVAARPHQVHPQSGARTTAVIAGNIRFVTCLAWESTPAEALKLIRLTAVAAQTLAPERLQLFGTADERRCTPIRMQRSVVIDAIGHSGFDFIRVHRRLSAANNCF